MRASWLAGSSGPVVIAGAPAESELLKRLHLPLDDKKHMPPKGRPPLTDDEAAVLTWWVEAGVPAAGTLRTLKAPAEVRVAFSRSLPAEELRAVEELQRRQAAEYETTLATVRAAVPGSLRAIVPGERDLEYSAAVAGAAFGDAELEKLSAAGKDLIWLDLSRTRITDAGLKALEKMPNLQHLDLRGTAVGDAGLDALAPLHNLRTLGLYGTAVTDAGTSGAATTLWLEAALCRRHQGDAPWSSRPLDGHARGCTSLLEFLRLRRRDDYPSQHSMKGSRVLLLASVLPVALVAAAAAPFVSWRKAAPTPAPAATPGPALPDTISFNQHIRPIFVANCFRCHGSDPGTREAELRLDRPEFAFAPRANGQPVIVKGDPGRSALVRRITSSDPDTVMPPPETHKTLEPARHRDPRALDQGGREVRAALGLHQARAPGTPRCAPVGIRVESHRPLRAGAAGSRGPHAQPGGRSSHPDPARHARPDGAAANPRGDRRVRSRHIPAGLRNAGRPAARASELRRAPGAILARRRALRRHARLSLRQLPQHLAVPRLGDRRLQRQPALRPVHAGTDCRRLVAEGHAQSVDCHGLHPGGDEHERRGDHPRGEPGELRHGSRRDHVAGLAGADDGVRALPRPQVRPDQREGLLQHGGVLPEHDAARHGRQRDGLAAGPPYSTDRGRRTLCRAARGDRRRHTRTTNSISTAPSPRS